MCKPEDVCLELFYFYFFFGGGGGILGELMNILKFCSREWQIVARILKIS